MAPRQLVGVGVGPGDPELVTVKAVRVLQAADLVLVPVLADDEPGRAEATVRTHVEHDRVRRVVFALNERTDAARREAAWDAAADTVVASMRQERINEVLVAHARAGRRVVRLKGGDPFVLGRGQEEVAACVAARVPVEVVPGVTSAVAVPAAAGIPVTHRGAAQGFSVVSGHVPPDDPRSRVDWAALARSGTTLVLLMAVQNLSTIVARLRDCGMSAELPAACVVDGCTPQQRVVTSTLGDLVQAAHTAEVANPAVVVVGEVAGEAATEAAVVAGAPTERVTDRVLVLGGTRSGKSATAERMLVGYDRVEYVATGPVPTPGDAGWAERVRQHRERRPRSWVTFETLDLEGLLGTDDAAPVLVDGLATWLAGILDECGVWDGRAGADDAVEERIDALVAAWRKSTRHVVAVSDEVGCGVVPESAAGRRFRDDLGRLNARIAAECQQVWLCTAGVPRRLR